MPTVKHIMALANNFIEILLSLKNCKKMRVTKRTTDLVFPVSVPFKINFDPFPCPKGKEIPAGILFLTPILDRSNQTSK